MKFLTIIVLVLSSQLSMATESDCEIEQVSRISTMSEKLYELHADDLISFSQLALFRSALIGASHMGAEGCTSLEFNLNEISIEYEKLIKQVSNQNSKQLVN